MPAGTKKDTQYSIKDETCGRAQLRTSALDWSACFREGLNLPRNVLREGDRLVPKNRQFLGCQFKMLVGVRLAEDTLLTESTEPGMG